MSASLSPVRRQFEKLEEKKRTLLARIQNLSPEDYLRQPAPNQWSVAQAATHLYLSEKLSLAYLRKKLSYPDSVPRYNIWSWKGNLLIKLTFWTSFKVKAPASINMWEHQEVLSHDQVGSKWSELRNELITFIESNEDTFGRHLAYRHPFAGRMTMHQMLIFLNDHMAHHIRQIDRIRKAISR